MKKIEELDVYWLVSSAGTFHVCRIPSRCWKFHEKYISVCRQVRREEGVDEPIPYEDLKTPPKHRDTCQKCMEELQKWKEINVSVRIDKESVIDAYKALNEKESVSDKRRKEALEELRSAIE